jgi:hypothetical protein
VPFAGRSHFGLIGAEGALIAAVFWFVAWRTRAPRAVVMSAFAGGLLAGAVNVGTDTVAHHNGWWRYPEATTPFGPLLYYVEAGIGCGALAMVAWWLWQRLGAGAAVVFIALLTAYGPIRDAATANATGLIDFDYSPFVVVVIADALSGFTIPVLVALATIQSTGSAAAAKPSR